MTKPAFTFQNSLALEPPPPRPTPWEADIAPAPMTVKQIAEEVMQRRGLDAGDARTAKLVSKLVNNAVTRQAADLVERVDNGRVAAWKVGG